MRLGRVAAAFVRRDLAILRSYRLALALRVAGLIAALLSLAGLARFVGHDEAARVGFVSFWLVGLAAGELFRAATSALSHKVREAQLEGTLEAMLSTPAPWAYVVLAAPLAELALAALEAAAILLAGVLLFHVSFGPVNVLSVVIVSLLALAAFAALGVLGGALTMALRRTDPITVILGLVGALLGGVLFPVGVLPAVVRVLAYALPLAPALAALREALFANAGLAALTDELIALGAFVVVVGPTAVALFAWALRRARDSGSLGHY